MTSINVKTLLLVNSADKCAKYWADQGNRVLYITHKPMSTLPQSIGIPKDAQSFENFNLIQFMYFPTWQDLLKHCYTIHLQPRSVSVIIVQELEHYCTGDGETQHDHVSLLCASLLQSAAVCASKNSKTAFLVSGFNSKTSLIYKTISKCFFHNIWHIQEQNDGPEYEGDRKVIKLSQICSGEEEGGVACFIFQQNSEETLLEFKAVFESVFEVYPENKVLK